MIAKKWILNNMRGISLNRKERKPCNEIKRGFTYLVFGALLAGIYSIFIL